MSNIVERIQDSQGNTIELPIPIDCGIDIPPNDMPNIITRKLVELAHDKAIDSSMPIINAICNYLVKYSNSTTGVSPNAILIVIIRELCKQITYNGNIRTNKTDLQKEACE